jgi:type VI secretion system protein ImpH
VITRLQAEPYRFQFMQAVRLLLIWLRRQGIRPERALRDILRFQNSPSLGFPASEIKALAVASELSGDAVWAPAEVSQIQITPAFIGLLGANGTLPLHYTEQIAAYEHAEQDASVRAFLDLFSDRAVSLFFQAWAKYRLEYCLDIHGEDRLRPMLLSLGCRRATRSQDGPQPDVIAFYIGLLRQRPVSAAALRCILPDYFGVPIAIDQFVGGWDDIADNRQCQMGGDNATLGHSGALGVRRWRHDLQVTLRIGPLGQKDFERFLPGAAGARELEAMLVMVGVAGLRYMAHVMLKPDDVAAFDLVGGLKPGRRLGWDARLGLAPGAQPTDVRYILRPS